MATEKEILDELLSGMEQLGHIADEQVEFWTKISPSTAADAASVTAPDTTVEAAPAENASKNFDETSDRDEAAQRSPLQQLYHERDQAIQRSADYYAERKACRDVPHSKSGLPDLSLRGGPWITKEDYTILEQSQKRKSSCESSQAAHAYLSNII